LTYAAIAIIMMICIISTAVSGSCDNGEQEPGEQSRASMLKDYVNKWALWDAEGQHLSMAEILAIRKDYGAGIYFFREKAGRDIDLRKLKESGLILVMTAHPGYYPFSSDAFLADEGKVRQWAKKAAAEPYVDALALDVESATATTRMYCIKILSEEAHKRGKLFHVVPHFGLDRWNDSEKHAVPEDYNKWADIAWPWLYNKYRQPTYKEGLAKMLSDWKSGGVKIPIYPIFDWGRPDYGGTTAAEAAEAPSYLREHGVSTVCLFQPHVSYREIAANADYRRLWNGLRDNYGASARASSP